MIMFQERSRRYIMFKSHKRCLAAEGSAPVRSSCCSVSQKVPQSPCEKIKVNMASAQCAAFSSESGHSNPTWFY